MNPQLRPLDPCSPAGRTLLACSEDYTRALYPEVPIVFDPPEALVTQGVHLLGLSRGDGVWLGCGAVRLAQDGPLAYGEVFRMFVHAPHRRAGHARQLLQGLERHLLAQGVQRARLVTGQRQPAAIALYEALGYRARPPFGHHPAVDSAVFMEKTLAD